jgi:hypothetical protein
VNSFWKLKKGVRNARDAVQSSLDAKIAHLLVEKLHVTSAISDTIFSNPALMLLFAQQYAFLACRNASSVLIVRLASNARAALRKTAGAATSKLVSESTRALATSQTDVLSASFQMPLMQMEHVIAAILDIF